MSEGKLYSVKLRRDITYSEYATVQVWAMSEKRAKRKAMNEDPDWDRGEEQESGDGWDVEDIDENSSSDAYESCDDDCADCGYAGACDNYKDPEEEEKDEGETEDEEPKEEEQKVGKNAATCTGPTRNLCLDCVEFDVCPKIKYQVEPPRGAIRVGGTAYVDRTCCDDCSRFYDAWTKRKGFKLGKDESVEDVPVEEGEPTRSCRVCGTPFTSGCSEALDYPNNCETCVRNGKARTEEPFQCPDCGSQTSTPAYFGGGIMFCNNCHLWFNPATGVGSYDRVDVCPSPQSL